MIIEKRLIDMVTAKIDAEDDRAKEMMAGGMLLSFDEYRHASGYRKALADCKTILQQTYEDLLKE